MYEVYDTGDIADWRRRYEEVGAPGPYHAPRYFEVLEGRFEFEAERAECFVYGDGDETVYYPYLRRPLDTVAFDAETAAGGDYEDVVSSWYYGGPVAATDDPDPSVAREFAEAFRAFCREEGIVAEFVRFDPNLGNHRDFPVLDPVFERETVPVDLTASQDTIWDGFEKRNRNAIRQAQDSDLEVEVTESDADYGAFHDIYVDAMEAKEASDHYRFDGSFFTALRDTGQATLVVSRYGDEVVGGSFLVHDDTIAHDYLRASDPDYWDMRVNNLLCYEALMAMKRTGRDLFDFQGGRPGVFKFKKAFSPDRRKFHIARRIHIDDVYDALVDEAESTGVDVESGYFPAYRTARSN